jgi:hypothetical protein
VQAANAIQTAKAPQEQPCEWRDLGHVYRLKADECLAWAGLAHDPKAREEWIRRANVWTQLALRASGS